MRTHKTFHSNFAYICQCGNGNDNNLVSHLNPKITAAGLKPNLQFEDLRAKNVDCEFHSITDCEKHQFTCVDPFVITVVCDKRLP